jgi:hypothetical protein
MEEGGGSLSSKAVCLLPARISATILRNLFFIFEDQMSRALALVTALSMTGCATMFGDKDRLVRVESKPPGAKVLLNGMPYGKTPTTIQISSMLSSNLVTVKKEGYEDLTIPIQSSLQGIAFLNLFNIICWGIDFATGNVYRIDTKVIDADLEKEAGSKDESSYLIPLNPDYAFTPSVVLMCHET